MFEERVGLDGFDDAEARAFVSERRSVGASAVALARGLTGI